MAQRTPPLLAVHEDRGARFTEFGGWEMPVEFDSIKEEHAAVRESVGKFDVSHMGEVVVSGPDACELTNRLTTNDVGALSVGDARYAAITDEEGIIIDDTVVYRQDDERYLFVPNAGHDEAAYDRWVAHRDQWGLDADVENRTTDYAMVAVQGPEAVGMAREAADTDEGAATIRDLSRFRADYVSIAGSECWVARTGYTGENGVEIVCPVADAEAVWTAFDCQPCGLGARDTLRLEAGLLLSGQDFDPEENPRTPYEAGIGFTVKLDTEFVGRDALEAQHEEGLDEQMTGLRLVDRGIPRHGYAITDQDGDEIGEVTSGTMSPTLGYPIAMGYVDVDYAEPGQMVRVVVRDEPKKAKVVTKPFLSNDE